MTENQNRDWAVEMRAVVDKFAGQEGYVPRIAASEALTWLRENDAELLAGWLDFQAEHFIWQAINDRDRSRRSAAFTHGPRERIRSAIALSEEAGDDSALQGLLAVPFTVESGKRLPLGELSGVDCAFVASGYRDRERQNGLRAMFLEKLGEKVGRDKVSKHFSNEQLERMLDSLGVKGL